MTALSWSVRSGKLEPSYWKACLVPDGDTVLAVWVRCKMPREVFEFLYKHTLCTLDRDSLQVTAAYFSFMYFEPNTTWEGTPANVSPVEMFALPYYTEMVDQREDPNA